MRRVEWNRLWAGWAALLIAGQASSSLALEVTILDGDGARLGGATVQARDGEEEGLTIVTGPDGTATVDLKRLPWTITAFKRGFAPVRAWWKGGREAKLEIRLPEAEPIGGQVLNSESAPIPEVKISVILPQRLAGPWVDTELFPVTTGPDGKWSCDWVPKGADYVQVDAFRAGYVFESEDSSREKLRKKTATHKLAAVVMLRGRVTNSDGAPVAEATVALGKGPRLWPGRDVLERHTDSEGRFEFPQIRVESHLLGVQSEAYAPRLIAVQVKPGMDELKVALSAGSRLRVKVVDETGRPIPEALCRVDEWPGDMNRNQPGWSYPGWEWKTDSSGLLEWANAPEQPALWSISRGGFMNRARVSLRPGGEASVTLLPPFALSGQVVDAQSGTPLKEFYVVPRFVTSPAAQGGAWSSRDRKQFQSGRYDMYFESPLLLGSATMHDWQFRAEAVGYRPAISRVLKHSETGARVDFALERATVPEIVLTEIKPGERITLGASLQTNRMALGESSGIYLKVCVAPGCYIHALNEVDAGRRTVIGATLPEQISLLSDWKEPEPEVLANGVRVHRGEVLFQNQILAGSFMRPGRYKIPLTLKFQACNDLVCWSAEESSQEAEIEITRNR